MPQLKSKLLYNSILGIESWNPQTGQLQPILDFQTMARTNGFVQYADARLEYIFYSVPEKDAYLVTYVIDADEIGYQLFNLNLSTGELRLKATASPSPLPGGLLMNLNRDHPFQLVNGEVLALHEYHASPNQSEIWLSSFDGKNRQRKIPTDQDSQFMTPKALGPDGRLLVTIIREAGPGKLDREWAIYDPVLDKSTILPALTDEDVDLARNSNASWSHDGTRIALILNSPAELRGSPQALYVLDLRTNLLRKMYTARDSKIAMPAWTLDDRFLSVKYNTNNFSDPVSTLTFSLDDSGFESLQELEGDYGGPIVWIN